MFAGAVVLMAYLHDGTSTLAASLEEAKSITASYEGRAFTPPPRKIEDIRNLLDTASDRNRAELIALRARADAAVPTGWKGKKRAEALRDRAPAAGEIGRLKQMIADLEAALDQGLSASRLLSEIYNLLAHAEKENGNLRAHAALRQKSLDALPSGERNVLRRHTRYTALALAKSLIGDLDGARKDLWTARSFFNKAEYAASQAAEKGRPRYSYFIPVNKQLMLRVESAIAVNVGRYGEAETKLRRALEIIDEDIAGGRLSGYQLSTYKMGTVRQIEKARILRTLAFTLTLADRYAEAEIFARDGIRLSVDRFGRNSVYTAKALDPLITVLSRTGRVAEARMLSKIALDIFSSLGVEPSGHTLNKARHKLADVLVAGEDWDGATKIYARIAEAADGDDLLLDRFYRYDLNRAVTLLRTDRVAEAARVTGPAWERLEQSLGAKHFDTAEAAGLHGVALQRQGKTAEALRAFRAAFRILTQRSRQTDGEEVSAGRDIRMKMVMEGYLDALDAADDPKAAEEAFLVANAARARSVQAALANSAARAAISDSDLRDLVRREQDAQKQIAALYGVLSNAMVGDGLADSEIVQLRTAIDELRSARATLMEEIEARFPAYADLINPPPVTIEQARAALRPGEALIAAFVGEKRTFVWAVPKQGEIAFAAVPLGRERIAAVVRDLRSALEPNASTLGGIPAFDVALAHKLYEALLAPVKAGWGDANSLLIVANGALGQLPLSLLVTEPTKLSAQREPQFANYRDVPWLARGHAVTVLPSVASLATLRALPPGDPSRRAFVGFGDPWFSADQAEAAETPARPAALASRGVLAVRGFPIRLRSLPKMDEVDSAELAQLPRLPDTADEVRGIALALNADLTKDVFLGKAANEGAVRSMDLSGVKVLAFATHGLVPGDLNGLTQPALALSSPEVAGGGGDGLLTMGEILGLKLDADWVVLSACNTAAGRGAGAEAVSGLGRAFFYAGTRALLVSNWPVETTSAKALTTDVFRRQAADPGLSRTEALRQAMLALIDGPGLVDGEGRSVFSYAHPIFWAPFSLIGDGASGGP
jgi:CHAT domain-containing protein